MRERGGAMKKPEQEAPLTLPLRGEGKRATFCNLGGSATFVISALKVICLLHIQTVRLVPDQGIALVDYLPPALHG